MRYQYKCDIKPSDLWKLSMYQTYHSLAGMCNLVLGAAMVVLAVTFWDRSSNFVQALLFLAALFVPVVHPLGVYLKAKAQASVSLQGTVLLFAEDGIHASLDGRKESIRWDRVIGVQKAAGMVIVLTGRGFGYVLARRVLGNEMDELYEYVKMHIQA